MKNIPLENEIIVKFDDGFVKKYPSAAKLLNDEKLCPIKDLCFKVASDSELMNNIIFCNDIYKIPPVKTFLIVQCEKLKSFASSDFPKREIGAFWGFLFKEVLGYKSSKNVTVTFSSEYGIPEEITVSTASYFFD